MFDLANHVAANNDTAEYAALFCLGSLSHEESEEFDRHLVSCNVCRDEVQRYADLLAKWALSSRAKVPEGARERFLASLKTDSPKQSASVLFRHGGLLISRPSDMDWQPGPVPGIWSKVLSSDPIRRYGTSLVRLDKGIRYPRHRHADVEEVYLLSGDLQVEGTPMRAGDYCRAESGSIHDESFTEGGCLLLILSSQLDEVLP